MATEYANSQDALTALNSAMAAAGLPNEDNRLIGVEGVLAEAMANILAGSIPSAAELPSGAGAGITAGVGTIYETSVRQEGGYIITRILMDITGLAAAAAGDIIGASAGGAAHIGQITTAVNGVIKGGYFRCLEAPAGGDTDIDLYAATVGTGAYDDAITGLVETQVTNPGALSLNTQAGVIADSIAANSYLYLVSVGATAAAYTAGRFMLELYGVPA